MVFGGFFGLFLVSGVFAMALFKDPCSRRSDVVGVVASSMSILILHAQ